MNTRDARLDVRDRLRALLAHAGFEEVETDCRERDGLWIRDEWERSAGWKLDAVDLSVRLEPHPELVVNLTVWLPLGEAREAAVPLDGAGLSWLAGRRAPGYPWKGILGRLTGSSGWEDVAEDARRHLGWFEEKYGDARKCRDALLSRGRNGVAVGHPAALAYLDGLLAPESCHRGER